MVRWRYGFFLICPALGMMKWRPFGVYRSAKVENENAIAEILLQNLKTKVQQLANELGLGKRPVYRKLQESKKESKTTGRVDGTRGFRLL